MAANMWKNSLKNAESDNNKILYETLLDFFLQRNGTYFLNKPRTSDTIKIFGLRSYFFKIELGVKWCDVLRNTTTS